MYYKKIFLLLLILPILLLSVTGCTSSQENGPTQPENNDIPAPPHEKPSSMPSPSITVELSFPDGAPSLNQTRELLCTVSTPGMRTDTGISIDIQLPDAFQLVSGELSWSGMVPGKSSIGVINPNLRSTTTGNWTINVSYQITPKPGGEKGTGYGHLYVTVSEDSAEWGKYPPWQKGPPSMPKPTPSPPLLTPRIKSLP